MLNPKIFTQEADFSMREDVREQLLNIALDFCSKALVEALDIIIVGSNASHHYDKDSDIDLHIILPQDEQLLEAVREVAKKENEHKPSVEGISIELYAQGEEEENRSAGVYSLINGWVKRPAEPIESTKPLMPDIESNVKQMSNKIDEAAKGEESNELMAEIKEMRKTGLKSGDGETSTGNLTFKRLRRNGEMEKLKAKTTDAVANIDAIVERLKRIIKREMPDDYEWFAVRAYEHTDDWLIEVANDVIDFYDAEKLVSMLNEVIAPEIFEPYSSTIWQAYVSKNTKVRDTLVEDPSVIDVENYVIGRNGIWFAKDKSEKNLLTKAYCSADEGKTWHKCYLEEKSPNDDGKTQAGKINFCTSYGVSPRTRIGRNVLTWYAAHGIHEIDRKLDIDHKDKNYKNDQLENLRRIPHDVNVKSAKNEQFRFMSIASGIGDAYEVIEIKGNPLPDETIEKIQEWSGAKITYKFSTYVIEGTSNEVDEAAAQISVALQEANRLDKVLKEPKAKQKTKSQKPTVADVQDGKFVIVKQRDYSKFGDAAKIEAVCDTDEEAYDLADSLFRTDHLPLFVLAKMRGESYII